MATPPRIPRLSMVSGGQAAVAVDTRDGFSSPGNRRRVSTTVRLAREAARPINKRTFGRFELLIEMGRGGMATLYLARIQGPQQFEKLLAIKKIHDHLSYEDQFVDMFLDEARIVALIHHPNVATLFDMGQIDDAYFIAMEYVHGQNLTDVLRAGSRHADRFPWSRAVRIVADAAAGLHAAHTLRNSDGAPLQVVHRDVSPQNILVSYDGHVKVVDFGIAYAAEKLSITGAGTLKGKVGYMAPEQTDARPVDFRADVFALGVVLYETTTISRLFRGASDAETLLQVRQAVVPSPRSKNPDLPPALEQIIYKALARRPEDRFSSAEELSDRLNELLVSEGEMVSRQKLAAMMSNMFYDRRKIKDQQIRIALRDDTAVPIAGMRVEETSSSIHMPQSFVARQLRLRRNRILWLVGFGTLAVLSALLLLLWAVRRGDRPDAARRSTPPSPAAGNPVNSKSALRFNSSQAPPLEAQDPRFTGQTATVTLDVAVAPTDAAVTLHFRGQTYRGA
ncbi:MAG: serine/threonine-protein kinase, partial [bacterium]